MRHAPISALAMLSLALSAIAGSPGESVQAAAADVASQPAEIRHSLRYLDLSPIPAERRKEFMACLAFHVNSLSRESDPVPLGLVGKDVIRVNLLDALWSRDVWEKFANLDPYFHAQLVKQVVAVVPEPQAAKTSLEGVQFFRDGATLTEVSRDEIRPGEVLFVRDRIGGPLRRITAPEKQEAKAKAEAKEKTLVAHAPWLPAKEIAALALATNSDAPIVRADWFIWQTAIQEGRNDAGYYDFLGVGKKEADFQELLGVDVKLAKKVRREMAASIGRSGVTLNNRGVEWYATISGDYYRTNDFKTSTFKQNTLRLLDGDTEPPHGDASEQYATLPNGLFAFWLQNANGERQNAAPDFIASDGQSSSTDRRVHVGLSCIRCHVEGIRPVNDWIRRVYSGPIALVSPDYAKLKRLRQLYLSDLESQVKRSQRNYGEALKRINGLSAAENARAYARTWDEYFETDLGPEETARELYVTTDAWVKALKAYSSRGGADPILTGLLANPPATIRREHWDELYGTAQTIIRGTKP